MSSRDDIKLFFDVVYDYRNRPGKKDGDEFARIANVVTRLIESRYQSEFDLMPFDRIESDPVPQNRILVAIGHGFSRPPRVAGMKPEFVVDKMWDLVGIVAFACSSGLWAARTSALFKGLGHHVPAIAKRGAGHASRNPRISLVAWPEGAKVPDLSAFGRAATIESSVRETLDCIVSAARIVVEREESESGP